jgi:hypothetical protein
LVIIYSALYDELYNNLHIITLLIKIENMFIYIVQYWKDFIYLFLAKNILKMIYQQSNTELDNDIVQLYKQVIALLEDPTSYEHEHEQMDEQTEESVSYNSLSKLLDEFTTVLTQSEMSTENEKETKLFEIISSFGNAERLTNNGNAERLTNNGNAERLTNNGSTQYDMTGVTEYLSKMYSTMSKNSKACSHFVFNLEFVESMESKYEGENAMTCPKLTDLMEMMVCKECKFSATSHSVCEKYNETELSNDYVNDLCGSCGMEKHYHQACKSFTFVSHNGKIEKKCTTCNMEYYHHIKRLEKEQIKQCHSFKDNSFGYCQTCCRHIHCHMYNEKHCTMNKNARDNFTIKNLQLSVKVNENLLYSSLVADIMKRIMSPDFKTLITLQKQNNYYSLI